MAPPCRLYLLQRKSLYSLFDMTTWMRDGVPVYHTHTAHMWALELMQIHPLNNIQSELCTLEVRFTKLYSNLINDMLNESHRLHYLLPEADNRRQLRHTKKYEPPKCQTENFKHSFVIHLHFKRH